MSQRTLVSGILIALGVACSGWGRDFFFDSGGVHIHYVVEGNGEHVVLIHGWGVDLKWCWEEPGTIESLAEHYQVIAIDARGHAAAINRTIPDSTG